MSEGWNGGANDADIYPQTEADRFEALGRRVEALLASEEPPDSLLARGSSYQGGRGVDPVRDAWYWFREQLLGGTAVEPEGVVARRWDREALVDYFEQNVIDTDDGQALPWEAYERLIEKLGGDDGR